MEWTTDAWSTVERLELMIPRPPRDAIAAAMAPSVTVSIGEERNPVRKAHGEGGVVGGEINVVQEKGNVIIGVGIATVEELGGS
jgi:hypothetical protein